MHTAVNGPTGHVSSVQPYMDTILAARRGNLESKYENVLASRITFLNQCVSRGLGSLLGLPYSVP